MNAKIKSLNFDNLLFMDIETVRGEETFDENHPHYDVWAWKQRDHDTNEIPTADEVIQSYYNKAALSAIWGKVVCISVGYISGGELHKKSFTGPEEIILREFVEMVKKSKRTLVGYNVIKFDIPFIRKRFFINGLDNYLDAKQGNDVYAKPWDLDESIFDLMVAWKGSSFANDSLDEVAMAFGIKNPKANLHGNEVSTYYYDGRLNEIVDYCEGDVEAVAKLLQAWKQTDTPKARLKDPNDAENFFN